MLKSFLFLILLIPSLKDQFLFKHYVEASFDWEEADQEESSAKFELIHRHASILSTVGRLERMKQLVHGDSVRRNEITHRIGVANRRRANELQSRPREMITPMRSASDVGLGEYFVSFRVGIPPQKAVIIADTGSDLTWLKCNYGSLLGDADTSEFHTEKTFWADRSPTFRFVPCGSEVCSDDLSNLFSLTECPEHGAPCAFDYGYADGSFIMGHFAFDTVTVSLRNKEPMRVRDILIGCSNATQSFEQTDGVMGLGYGKHSFAIRAAEEFGAKFSYCLVDHLSPSNHINYLTFGNATRTSLPDMQQTELIVGHIGTFYAVDVQGISVDGKMLDIPAEVWNVTSRGGVILDTGTTLTALAGPAYEAVITAMNDKLSKLERVEIPDLIMEYCFNSSGFQESDAQELSIHFKDGAVFRPLVNSYVLDVDDDVKCLGFTRLKWPDVSVIGNILQQNHLWEFDVGKHKLGFAPSSCAVVRSKSLKG
uniref:Peptidase A1 domain-containing protein n=1 Tax=Kalanchoe fedtschenkoi TaxID=63787 RepID=A0A7N0TUZ1_KALFE